MKQEIEGQTVHTGEIKPEELEVGDTIFFPTEGEKNDKKVKPMIGWEYLATINAEAAATILLREHPNSVFNSEGQSPAGNLPAKMAEWEVGAAIVHEFNLYFAYKEQTVILLRAAHDSYVIMRSRQLRETKRFSAQ